jgi:hypothetical protein
MLVNTLRRVKLNDILAADSTLEKLGKINRKDFTIMITGLSRVNHTTRGEQAEVSVQKAEVGDYLVMAGGVAIGVVKKADFLEAGASYQAVT